MLQDQWLGVAVGAVVTGLPGDHAREHYLPSYRRVPHDWMLAVMCRSP